MPITDYSEFKRRYEAFTRSYGFTKQGTTLVNILGSYRRINPFSAAIPSTPASLDHTDSANLLQSPEYKQITNPLYLAEVQLEYVSGAGAAFHMLVDRLAEQGGLSGTVTSEQTTNLPLAAPPRADTAKTWVGIHIYTAVGNTATTLTVEYTNHLGAPNKISQPVVFGGTNNQEANRFIIVPLADGDIGVSTVTGVTLAASTGTAGNFGVVLFRPLAFTGLLMEQTNKGLGVDKNFLFGGALIEYPNQACLDLISMVGTNAVTAGHIMLLEAP